MFHNVKTCHQQSLKNRLMRKMDFNIYFKKSMIWLQYLFELCRI